MCTDALIAVPRLVGQKVSQPSLSSEVKDMRESMCSIPSISSWNTRPTSPPGAMEMILRWSSSPTHTRKVFSSLWKIPRPVGQYLLAFAAFRWVWLVICNCPLYSIVMGLDLQEPVALLEKKMVVNQLLLHLV